MATYVVLIDFTDQGIRTIRESPARADAFAGRASELGVEVRELYWTSGSHDGVLILEAAEASSVSSLLLSLATAGNVRTNTLRAYDRGEMEKLLADVEPVPVA